MNVKHLYNTETTKTTGFDIITFDFDLIGQTGKQNQPQSAVLVVLNILLMGTLLLHFKS